MPRKLKEDWLPLKKHLNYLMLPLIYCHRTCLIFSFGFCSGHEEWQNMVKWDLPPSPKTTILEEEETTSCINMHVLPISKLVVSNNESNHVLRTLISNKIKWIYGFLIKLKANWKTGCWNKCQRIFHLRL